MGFNTTVMVNNDVIHEIAKDQDFGKRLADHMLALSAKKPQTFMGGGVQVVEQHHADNLIVVAVGGGTAQVLGWGGDSRGRPSEVDILKELARQHGYNLHKAPKRDRKGKFEKKGELSEG